MVMALPRQFVRGDRFNPTASDANRILKKALEADQGAGNLSAREIREGLQLGHIFIKNNTGGSLDRFSVVGLGDRLYPFRLNQNRLNWEINAWNGDTINVRRHWYHFAVVQQSCSNGEIVRAAIDGMTFVRMTGGASPSEGSGLFNMALNASGASMQPSSYGHHARLLAPADTNSASEDNPGLVSLGHYSRVWAAIVESRTDTDTLVGYLDLYGSGSDKQQINIEDDYDLLPSTTDLPTGTVDNFRVAVEICQNDSDSDIFGRLLTIPRDWTTLGVEMSVPPL
jgi:hypothetical protein